MRFQQLLAYLLLFLPLAACNFSTVKSQSPHTHGETAAISDPAEQAWPRADADQDPTWHDQQAMDTGDNDTSIAAVPADDLWQVIRQDLRLRRHTDNRKVQAKLAWFKRNQAYLDRVAGRATPYLYHIVTELRRRDLSMELALLPVVESAYQPFAHSPSRASGLWQFIPGTGKRFGLKQNWWYDGRRDIITASDAAFKYLGELNQRFNGDWELSLAAYNAGEFRIERAIKRNRAHGKAADFWSLDLPRETENYVPSLLAIAEIIAHPEKYNINLRPIANRPHFDVIQVDGQIDLAMVAELSGLDMDAIYTLNPGFNRWATDPAGPHRLLLPVNVARNFEKRLAAIPGEDRISWKRYVIQRGDTLGGIARHHRTSITALKDSNRLRGNRIRAGKSLLIPVSSKPSAYYTLSEESRRFRHLKASPDGSKYVYTIKRGDTLWDIGRQYGISIRQMCQWNGIQPGTILRPGQKIEIFIQQQESAGGIMAAVAHPVENPAGTIHYQVQAGDSLWLIARKFGVSVSELRKWNKLPKSRHLQPGQQLQIRTATTGA